jgi:valyl-tRNA synthetase
VPVSHRSGERIEPLISLQWFMRMDELAAPAIEAVEAGRVRIHPEGQRQVYLDWMGNIRPWCISRQLWWGHQLPVWYRGEETYVGTEPPEGEGWVRDPDVLDTWFSSALWPFATLGWPEQTPELRAFYPTDVLLTARDILFLWVARMVMMGIEFTGEVPFSDVYVHSIIQAPDGRRMSKSLGTGVDPLDLIEGGPRPPAFKEGGEFPAYGADALRFGLLTMSSVQDVRFSEEKIQQGQQLANKLWNASRLILLGVADGARPEPRPRTPEDHWILGRLLEARAHALGQIESFDFAHAALGLYSFIYGELCDWYLELVKPRLYEREPEVSSTLLHVLRETLAIAHPFIPFVTEEIWSYLPGAEGLLAGYHSPEPDWSALRDQRAEQDVERMIEAVQALRRWRDSVRVPAGARVPARLEAAGYDGTAEHMARLAQIDFAAEAAEPVAAITVPGGTVQVLPGGAFDPADAERRRDERCAALEADIARSEAKLANEPFVERAPAAVVQAERDKLARLRAELEAL